MPSMNKAGKQNPTVMIFGIIVVIALIVLIYMTAVPQTMKDTEGVSAAQQSCADASGILTVSDISKIPGGTAPSSPTITCGLEGQNIATSVTSGTTTFPVGAKVICLDSDTDSLDDKLEFTMPCGGITVDGALYYSTSDNPSITVKDFDAQSNDLTNNIAGGAYNASNPTAGSTFDVDVKFESTSYESSGDGIFVIEFPAGSDANITQGGVTLGGLSEVSKPRVHSSINAGSRIVAFEVPMVADDENGKSATYELNVDLESAKDLTGGVYMDWYAKQWFIDDDKTVLTYGIEDSTGDAKYENTLDFDFFIA